MLFKNLLIYFNIFVLAITIAFSNIYSDYSCAEPRQSSAANQTEELTETTTEAPSVIKNYCEADKEINVQARAAVIADANSGIPLYEKNADEVLYPASITKIMTALLICEYGKFDEKITHSHNAVYGIGYGSSTMGMKEGETISLLDALYGILLSSANEACMAAAEHISGSVDNFVAEMNDRAAKLGCKNTHFANPHGFHDANHYTSAGDMAKIACEAVKNEKFSEVWGSFYYKLPATNMVNEERGLFNRAKILDDESRYYYPYITGAKTGFHDEAMNTLVCCAEKDGVKLIAVIMKDKGADAAYSDARALFDYGFSQYEDKVLYKFDSSKNIYEGTELDGEVSVVQTYNGAEYTIGSVDTEAKGEIKAKAPKFISENTVKLTPSLLKKKEAPVAQGDILGSLSISYEGYTLGEADITAKTAVNKLSNSQMMKKELLLKTKQYLKAALDYLVIPIVFIIALIIFIIVIRIIRNHNKKKRRKKHKKRRKRRTNTRPNTRPNTKFNSRTDATQSKNRKRPPNRRHPANDGLRNRNINK